VAPFKSTVWNERNEVRMYMLPCCRFPMQDIKGHMMDLRTVDGSILKISTPNGDQELAKTLGVEMVQNMYKVGSAGRTGPTRFFSMVELERRATST